MTFEIALKLACTDAETHVGEVWSFGNDPRIARRCDRTKEDVERLGDITLDLGVDGGHLIFGTEGGVLAVSKASNMGEAA